MKFTAKSTKRSAIGKLSAVMLIALSAVTINFTPAYAATAYDSIIHPASQLEISDGGSGTTDISANWRSVLASCNASASASLENAIQHQGHWLVMIENPGVGSDAYIKWTTDTASYSDFFMYGGSMASWGTSPATYGVVRIASVNSSGVGSCSEYYPTVTASSWSPLVTVSTGSQLPIFVSTFPISYDPAYEGAFIPSGPTFTPIGGSIECFNGNDSISSVYVTPSDGVSGFAALSGNGASETYTYYLSEESDTYSLLITCGDVTQGTDPATVSVGANVTWYCSTLVSAYCYDQ